MSQEWKAPTGEEDDVQMPLGVGGDAAPAEDYSPPKTRVNTSTLALVASFAAALVVLYFLGLQNKPRGASAEEVAKAQATTVTIEGWIRNKTGQAQVKDFGDSLITLLSRYFDKQAGFRIEDLEANPFEHAEKVEVVVPPPVGGTIIAPQPGQTIDPELLEAAKEFSSLKLQMVMVGTPSSALINNQIVHVGSKFKYLTVTDIQADCVLMGFKERAFTLKSNSPQMGKP